MQISLAFVVRAVRLGLASATAARPVQLDGSERASTVPLRRECIGGNAVLSAGQHRASVHGRRRERSSSGISLADIEQAEISGDASKTVVEVAVGLVVAVRPNQ